MKSFIIVNTQAFGDGLLGTHLASLIKRDYPDSHISFIKTPTTLTTAEKDASGLEQMLDIYFEQSGIDSVGYADKHEIKFYKTRNREFLEFQFNEVEHKIYYQNEWYSNYGCLHSMLLEYELEGHIIDTETYFYFGKLPSRSKDKLVIATAGPLDWNRKWGQEKELDYLLRFFNKFYPNIEIKQFGTDIKNQTYLEALQEFQDCHLYIGPAGSLGHAAAGVNMDTIILCEVFPPEMLSPEYYHTGYHKSIVAHKENHCGSYVCIEDKPFLLNTTEIQKGWGNPKTKWDFWTKTCWFTKSGKSCVNSVTWKQLAKAFNNWYTDRRLYWIDET